MKFHHTIKNITVFESEREMLTALISGAVLIDVNYDPLSEIWINEAGMLTSYYQPAIAFRYNVINDYENYTFKG